MYLQNIHSLQKKLEHAPYFKLFYILVYKETIYIFKKYYDFYQFISAVKRYRIIKKIIYNFDERGFMIGVGITSVQVMIHEKLKSGEIIEASQDGNREQVLLLAVIYTIASVISPALIYERRSKNLKDMQTDDIGLNKTYSAAIFTGQSNNKIER